MNEDDSALTIEKLRQAVKTLQQQVSGVDPLLFLQTWGECALCGHTYMAHIFSERVVKKTIDHPFFHNNLERLEWEVARRV